MRTYGQLLAHVADAQYIMCGMVESGKPVMKTNEKTAKTKSRNRGGAEGRFRIL